MQNTLEVNPHDRLQGYVLGFANGLFYFNAFLLLQIFCAYVLANDNGGSVVWLIYALGGILTSMFILLLPFIYLIPALIYMLRWSRSENAKRNDIKFVLVMTVITAGLIIWFSKAPFFKLV